MTKVHEEVLQRSKSVLGRAMSSVSRGVSGLIPIRGMIEKQSVQSASVKGSTKSSDSVIDASHVESAHHQRRF